MTVEQQADGCSMIVHEGPVNRADVGVVSVVPEVAFLKEGGREEAGSVVPLVGPVAMMQDNGVERVSLPAAPGNRDLYDGRRFNRET